MEYPLSLQVEYWAIQEGPDRLLELDGIREFQSELDAHYVARVRSRPGDLGGGLYEFAVHALSNISIHDVLKLVADGVAFDLLKSGARSFVLRPFLAAYKKLRSQNPERNVDISELHLTFADAEVVITKICSDSIYESLGQIFQTLGQCYPLLRNGRGEYPYSIQVPVFQDPEQRLCRFRVLLDVDETIRGVTTADYLGYWGVTYDYERTFRVFDVRRRLLIDSDFLSNARYWQEWARERKREESA
ncbi:MAG: hypothetical protein F9K13_07600 [Candidatus Methylomirabilis oxygeniifera]|uniref:Uncharacterized protein n=1 Tax=Methylomirabilis oxygeniifera TaxID=671143 RepID=D5MLQ8_METO1|nr:MAG: hypothetical protein F9K13_07600 [Candidatus Methylomirabilis oxyfera]CBE69965.1 protein of unknown function [Candidatus Methylomirabilis oxyfera]